MMKILAFNKPYGVLTKFTDREGRPTLSDFIPVPGVYPAGRLDKDSEGLLILTDDGEVQQLIADPRHRLVKIYWAQVERIPQGDALLALAEGVIIEGKKTLPAEVRLLEKAPSFPERSKPIRYRENVPTAWIELRIREGRNRQVRKMTASVGHPTLRLVRVAVGPVTIKGLSQGEWRDLTPHEISAIGRLTKK